MPAPSPHAAKAVESALDFAERVALFVTALHRDVADELLAGFSSAEAKRALAFSRSMKRWDSATRQARLSHRFGLKPDAADRLEELLRGCQGDLREAVLAAVPLPLRGQLHQEQVVTRQPSEAVRALAARLVQEASR